MKRLIVTLIAILPLTFIACNDDDNDEALCLRGGGNVMEYELNVANFSRIALIGPVDLLITQGSEQGVVVRAEPELFEPLQYSVSGDLFQIGYENVRCFETDFGVEVQVTIADLKEVLVSGASKIRSEGELEFEEIEFDVAGTGDISITGSIDDVKYESAGSVVVKNFGLETANTTIEVAGAGEFEVLVNENLDITVSGAATINYKGNPTINQNVSGSLNLNDAN